MIRHRLIFVLTIMIYGWNVKAQNRIFYVVSSGEALENAKTHFNSIDQAYTAALAYIREHKPEKVTLQLDAGRHLIQKPLVIESADVGDCQLTIEGSAHADTYWSGGIEVKDWVKDKSGQWVADLPTTVRGSVMPRELFIGKIRGQRAKYPNNDYLRIDSAGLDKRSHFFYKAEDWPSIESKAKVELVIFHDWSTTRIDVETVDHDQNKVTTVDHIGAKVLPFFTIDNWEKQPRYFLENAHSFLDRDYEWYIDPMARKVYLKLPQNMNPNRESVFLPHSEGLLVLSGQKNRPIRQVQIRHIIFEHSRWDVPPLGYAGIQAGQYDPRGKENKDWDIIPAAVSVTYGKHCLFEYCTFTRLGSSGLWLGEGTTYCRVEHSIFKDISGNGIMIGEGNQRKVHNQPWWKIEPNEVALGNQINKCYVGYCGQQFYGTVGIWVGLTAETEIKYNEICHLPYTGLSIGWMWSPVVTPCRDNKIIDNYIHDVMKKLSDGGGIYSLGLQPGSEIRGNIIHGVLLNVGRAESNGMFLDEGTKSVVVEENVVWDIAKSPLRFHKAEENWVRKNVLGVKGNQPMIRYNNTVENKIVKENNRVLSAKEDYDDFPFDQIIAEWQEKYGMEKSK